MHYDNVPSTAITTLTLPRPYQNPFHGFRGNPRGQKTACPQSSPPLASTPLLSSGFVIPWLKMRKEGKEKRKEGIIKIKKRPKEKRTSP